jgi:hypothetical protein
MGCWRDSEAGEVGEEAMSLEGRQLSGEDARPRHLSSIEEAGWHASSAEVVQTHWQAESDHPGSVQHVHPYDGLSPRYRVRAADWAGRYDQGEKQEQELAQAQGQAEPTLHRRMMSMTVMTLNGQTSQNQLQKTKPVS